MTYVHEDAILAEQIVVGHAISSRDGVEAVVEIVPAACFARPAHQVMVASALRLAERGDPVDPVSVLSELLRSGEIRALGRADYVHDCFAAEVPQWEYHARRVRAEFLRISYRQIMASELQEADEPGFDFGAAMERIGDRLDALEAPDDAPLRTMSQLVTDVLESLETKAERGLQSPWRDLNDAINGLAPGQVCIVGARPGGGKSIVGGQWALHAAMKVGVPVLLASMEMSAEEITTRLISATAKVPLTHLLRRELDDGDWQRIGKYQGDVADSTLTIDDGDHISLAHIRSRLRSMSRTAKAGLLVVDYLTLLEPPEGSESHRVGIVRLSKGLKRLAREFAIPVIVLAQLSREADKRQPMMSDLAESSQIEADADIVLLLHRPDQNEGDNPRAGEVDVIVEKNRTGAKTTVTLTFQGHYGRCMDLQPEPWSPTSALEKR